MKSLNLRCEASRTHLNLVNLPENLHELRALVTKRHAEQKQVSTRPRSKMATESEEMLANMRNIRHFACNLLVLLESEIKDMGTHIYHLISLKVGL